MLRKLYWSARSLFASPPPAQPEYFSRFGGLWTDRRDALAVLDRKAAQDPARRWRWAARRGARSA